MNGGILFEKNIVKNKNQRDLEYYRKIDDLHKYAMEFFSKIVDDYFPNLKKDILPINFKEFLNDRKEDGVYRKINKQHIIEIFDCRSGKIDLLKETIRHEIIHYTLDMVDCRNEDDDVVFHILCSIYDGGAYKDMVENHQKLFNYFMLLKNIVDKQRKFEYIKKLINTFGSKKQVEDEEFREIIISGLMN